MISLGGEGLNKSKSGVSITIPGGKAAAARFSREMNPLLQMKNWHMQLDSPSSPADPVCCYDPYRLAGASPTAKKKERQLPGCAGCPALAHSQPEPLPEAPTAPRCPLPCVSMLFPQLQSLDFWVKFTCQVPCSFLIQPWQTQLN